MNDYDLWFILLNISNRIKINLIKRFKNTKEIWYYTLNEENTILFNKKIDINKSWDAKRIENLKTFLFKNQVNIVMYKDELYPKRLIPYEDMPCYLFYKGDISKLDKCDNLSVVGSRDCSSYGINVTKIIVKELCNYNINIISGLAKGIDSYAHSTCIENHGFTCAILGTGIDIVYPRENKKLFNDILRQGCIISQFLPGTKPFSYNFPNRNRLISALSKITTVIEAGERSGSLITAGYALEQGNDVIAVPGSVFSKNSIGTNKLIRDGAATFTSMEDLLNLMGIEYNKTNSYNSRKMSPLEQKIYSILSDSPIHIDDIIKITNVDIRQIYELLFEMQLKDEIMCLSGNFYVKNQKAI